MGIYFNPNNGSFRKDSRSRIYIDKTGLLEELNQVINSSENCIAVSHARRFGKSQAAGMIDAYYSCGSDSRELFAPFRIAQAPDFEEHLNQYNVIHLDISSYAAPYKETLVETLVEVLHKEFRQVYEEKIDYTGSIGAVLMQVYELSGRPFVIIIDEWDCVVRNQADCPELVHKYLQFLHDLFKSEEAKQFLALGYITGILPIKKIKDESALNNFEEYTMLGSAPLTEYFGFTEDEVRELCAQYGMEFESIQKWYNGYLIDGRHMYNPNSVYRAMRRKKLESYWKDTSAFDTINTFITLDYQGLKEDVLAMLAGEKVVVNVNTFRNDLTVIRSKDEALTALIHLGYLGYDAETKEAYVPNYEVAMAYHAALESSGWNEVAASISKCQELLNATICGDTERVAQLIDLAHSTYTSILKYNDENSLSCALTMAYFTAPAYYNIIRELPSGKGFADLAFIPRADAGGRPAIIVELKWDEDADTAIRQIKERRYAGSLKGYGEKILLVGINYDKDSADKKHRCVIEEITNE